MPANADDGGPTSIATWPALAPEALYDPARTVSAGRRCAQKPQVGDSEQISICRPWPHLILPVLAIQCLAQVRGILASPEVVTQVWCEICKRMDKSTSGMTEMQVTVAMNRIDLIWDQLFPLKQHRILELLIDRVIISPNELLVRMHPNGVENLALDVSAIRSARILHQFEQWHEDNSAGNDRRPIAAPHKRWSSFCIHSNQNSKV